MGVCTNNSVLSQFYALDRPCNLDIISRIMAQIKVACQDFSTST